MKQIKTKLKNDEALRTSPFAQTKGIEIGECIWTEGFWADKFRVCQNSMLPYMEKLLTGKAMIHALCPIIPGVIAAWLR